MRFSFPSPHEPFVDKNQKISDAWYRLLSAFNGSLKASSYLVTALPSAGTPGEIIYVSNETGGAVLAFSDGTDWRRVTDRTVVS